MSAIVESHRHTDDLPILRDPAVPSEDLLGPGAAAAISAVLGAVGGTVESSQPTQTTYHPGRSLTVAHRVRVRWDDPDASKVRGRHSTETVVLGAGRRVPAGATILSDGTTEIVAWQVPHDPWLPGLAPALDPVTLVPLLRQIGIDAPSPTVTVRAYRPGRRAVLEVTASETRVFLKIVPPRSVEALHRRHEDLAATTPVPRSLGWSPEHGIVVLQAVAGRTLRQALFGGFGLPGPDSLLTVLDALPHDPSWETSAVPHDWRAHDFARLLGSVMPEISDRVTRLADGLQPFAEAAASEPIVAVHGDFYEAQLLVDGGAITGLLDVDTHGPGRRVDDLATMIGHLAVLAIGQPRQTPIERYAAHLLDGFDRTVDPAVLRAGVAGVVLGLATGSFRVLETRWRHHTETRITAAEAWLASAERLGIGEIGGTART